MELTQDLFAIDCAAVSAALEAFIRDSMEAMGRQGILVPLSGGLDSSTVAALCARAVGPEKVVGLMLPDATSAPAAGRFARLVGRALGIRLVRRDSTLLNLAAGTYRFAANAVPFRALLARIVKWYMARSGKNLFIEGMAGTGGRMARSAMASFYTRQRLRMVSAFRYAELRGLMVAGSAHLSEDLLGLFVKFGIDDSADIMPLKRLYRSQVLRLAAWLGLPRAVLERSPDPEMLAGIEDKYYDVLGIRSAQADLVLYGIGAGMPDGEIDRGAGIPEGKAAELRRLVGLSAHMRNPSATVDPPA